MLVSLTTWSSVVMPLMTLPAVHTEREHPFRHCRGSDLCCRHILHDQLSQPRRHVHRLVETLTSLEPGPLARFATAAAEERQLGDWSIESDFRDVRRRELRGPRLRISESEIAELELAERRLAAHLRHRQLGFVRHELLRACGADARNEALGDDQIDG